jgi:hypothetical protein
MIYKELTEKKASLFGLHNLLSKWAINTYNLLYCIFETPSFVVQNYQAVPKHHNKKTKRGRIMGSESSLSLSNHGGTMSTKSMSRTIPYPTGDRTNAKQEVWLARSRHMPNPELRRRDSACGSWTN